MASRQVVQNNTNSLESALRIQRVQKRELRRPQLMKRWSSTLSARNLMTSPVVTVRPEESVENAARLMSELNCGALPVVDSSCRLIGIIACSDITTRLIARGITVQYAQVSDCMTHQAFAVSVDTSIEDCVHAMSWHQVRRMPIVDNDHRVIGVISMSDVTSYVSEHAGGRHIGFADALWQLVGHAEVSPDMAS